MKRSEKMNKLLENEYQELNIKTENEMSEKLKFISDNLSWRENDVNNSHIIVAEPSKNEIEGQMQLLEDGTCGTFVDALERYAPLSDREAAEQVYRESNRFVILKNERNSMEVVPTFHTAQTGLLKRRGCFCPAVMSNYAINRPTPTMEETFLNDAANRCKSKERWGILDGGCIANVSESYVVLDAFQGYDNFKKIISDTWEDTEFSTGIISYEGYMADFMIKDELAIDGLKNILEELGVTVESINAFARYTTSDVTQSAMAGTIYYVLNGTPIRLASKIGVEHKGDSSVALFTDKIKDLGMLLKESEEQVEKLGNTTIDFPANCLENALKKVHLLNKRGVEAVDEININPDEISSALDVIIKVNSVLKATSEAEDWPATKLLNYSEEVSKLLNSKFSELDKVA